MCTVSFISSGNKSFITSNRDEHVSRPSSFQPKEEIINGCKVIYPKDPKAGGTWFAVNFYGTVGVLLNGAFEKHLPTGRYVKSRGLILLDIITDPEPVNHIRSVNLVNIEPFTVILFDKEYLIEFRWDGALKHMKKLDSTNNYIWSSATLYSTDVVKKREVLFANFLSKYESYTSKQIVDFHISNDGDENGFIIDKNTGMKTFSVTQASISENEILINHINLLENTKYMSTVLKQHEISTV